MQMAEKAVISDELHLKWWPPPSWIYYCRSFWSNVPFLVRAVYIAAKFLTWRPLTSWILFLFSVLPYLHVGPST